MTSTPECPPGARLIPLTKGMHAIVDEADYDDLSQFKWLAHKDGKTYYAIRFCRQVDDCELTRQKMHRRLLPEAQIVDHINGNGLDNRRINLRAATQSQNLRNRRGATARSTSGFLGVFWDRRAGKWRAEVKMAGRSRHVGLFDDPVEAARRRDAVALEAHGEFAALNFPVDPQGEVA